MKKWKKALKIVLIVFGIILLVLILAFIAECIWWNNVFIHEIWISYETAIEEEGFDGKILLKELTYFNMENGGVDIYIKRGRFGREKRVYHIEYRRPGLHLIEKGNFSYEINDGEIEIIIDNDLLNIKQLTDDNYGIKVSGIMNKDDSETGSITD